MAGLIAAIVGLTLLSVLLCKQLYKLCCVTGMFMLFVCVGKYECICIVYVFIYMDMYVFIVLYEYARYMHLRPSHGSHTNYVCLTIYYISIYIGMSSMDKIPLISTISQSQSQSQDEYHMVSTESNIDMSDGMSGMGGGMSDGTGMGGGIDGVDGGGMSMTDRTDGTQKTDRTDRTVDNPLVEMTTMRTSI